MVFLISSFASITMMALIIALGIYFKLEALETVLSTIFAGLFPYLVASVWYTIETDKKLKIHDNILKAIFKSKFNDAIRFKDAFGSLIDQLLALDRFSEIVVNFTEEALDDMGKKGIIKVGCEPSDYIKFIRKAGQVCKESVVMTLRIPPKGLQALNGAEEVLQLVEGIEVKRPKIRIVILKQDEITKLQRRQLEEDEVKWLTEINPSVQIYWGRYDKLGTLGEKRGKEKWVEFEDFILFDEALMIQYDFLKGILTFTWHKDRINFAMSEFISDRLTELIQKGAIFQNFEDII